MLLTLGCETMREGVVATMIFFVAGLLLVLAGVNIIPALWHLNHIVIFVGFLLLLLAPIILISTFLLTVLPDKKIKKKMDECKH